MVMLTRLGTLPDYTVMEDAQGKWVPLADYHRLQGMLVKASAQSSEGVATDGYKEAVDKLAALIAQPGEVDPIAHHAQEQAVLAIRRWAVEFAASSALPAEGVARCEVWMGSSWRCEEPAWHGGDHCFNGTRLPRQPNDKPGCHGYDCYYKPPSVQSASGEKSK